MENFTAYTPTRLHFGKDVLNSLGEEARLYGKKALLDVCHDIVGPGAGHIETSIGVDEHPFRPSNALAEFAYQFCLRQSGLLMQRVYGYTVVVGICNVNTAIGIDIDIMGSGLTLKYGWAQKKLDDEKSGSFLG